MSGSPDESAGLYVHVPFCVVRCTYCDFYSQTGADHLAKDYIAALERDLASFTQRTGYAPRIETIFLGGGTPSFVEPDGIVRVLGACRSAFDVEPDAEITIEANPESLTAESVETWLRGGVNRLSVGIQSLRDGPLRMMGRPHDAARGVAALRCARQAGAGNLSADFIYGLPGQTAASWREDLARIVDLGLDHVSAYILETDKTTPLARAIETGELPEPDADEVALQWEATCSVLGRAPWSRYEVSNFAMPGFECRHNLIYWTDRAYLGFGASAHGYWRGQRTAVAKSAVDYIAAVGRGETPFDVIDPPDEGRRLSEAIVTGLRLARGCDFGELSRRYGIDLFDRYAAVLEEESRQGRLRTEGERVVLTPGGVLFSNEVLCRFV